MQYRKIVKAEKIRIRAKFENTVLVLYVLATPISTDPLEAQIIKNNLLIKNSILIKNNVFISN